LKEQYVKLQAQYDELKNLRTSEAEKILKEYQDGAQKQLACKNSSFVGV
jgi:hypothetical protein